MCPKPQPRLPSPASSKLEKAKNLDAVQRTSSERSRDVVSGRLPPGSPLPEPSAYFFRGLSQKKVPLRVSKWKVSFPAAEKRSSQARFAKRNFQSDHLLPALLVHLAPGCRKARGSGNHVSLETRGQGHRTRAQTLPGHTQPRRPESSLRSARLQASPALHPLLPGTPAWKLGTGSERV